MDDRDLWRAVVAEFIGPFTLVVAGVGAIISTQNLADGGNLVAVSLAHGLAIGLMFAALAHVSGGHFNPAVTISMFATGGIGLTRGISYVRRSSARRNGGSGCPDAGLSRPGTNGTKQPGRQSRIAGARSRCLGQRCIDHGNCHDVLPGHGHLRDRRRSRADLRRSRLWRSA